jgi:hypothetical protein
MIKILGTKENVRILENVFLAKTFLCPLFARVK